MAKKKTLHGVGRRIRQRRLDLGLTQEELAARAGTSQTQIQKIEVGRVAAPRNIAEIAAALDTSPAWLQFGVEEIDDLSEEALALAIAWDELPEAAKAAVLAVIASHKPS